MRFEENRSPLVISPFIAKMRFGVLEVNFLTANTFFSVWIWHINTLGLRLVIYRLYIIFSRIQTGNYLFDKTHHYDWEWLKIEGYNYWKIATFNIWGWKFSVKIKFIQILIIETDTKKGTQSYPFWSLVLIW